VLQIFCDSNNLCWVEPITGSIPYTYHSDVNDHYSLTDHFVCSPQLINNIKGTSILIDDIMCVCTEYLFDDGNKCKGSRRQDSMQSICAISVPVFLELDTQNSGLLTECQFFFVICTQTAITLNSEEKAILTKKYMNKKWTH